jgi:hypothetical protein
VGSGFVLDPASLPRLQSLTRNRFRFGDGRIVVDLPAQSAYQSLPLLRSLLEAL